jgi:hypothetical protein
MDDLSIKYKDDFTLKLYENTALKQLHTSYLPMDFFTDQLLDTPIYVQAPSRPKGKSWTSYCQQ